MNPIESIKTCVKKSFVWKGRASRSEFLWWYLIFCIIFTLVYMNFIEISSSYWSTPSDFIEISSSYWSTPSESSNALLLLFIVNLLLLFPTLAVSVRRLHDSNKSAWFLLWNLLPILGPIISFIALVAKSDAFENKYGPVPSDNKQSAKETVNSTINNVNKVEEKLDIAEEEIEEVDNEELVQNEELAPNEAKYKEEVLFLLEEGAIDAEGRKLLERKRVRWEISEERANEIEQMCFSASYTKEEQEYMEIYQELCADGEMTERKRRMLDRERDLLGISQERAKELESL
jgi:uncharacterized membrane protein YhaH (DUF805 family)